jgi:hypothetical protein
MGLNLQCAQRIILLDPVYDNNQMEQLIGIYYREGQEKDVFLSVCDNGYIRRARVRNLYEKKFLKEQIMSEKPPDIIE